MIRIARIEDMEPLARIYKDLYDAVDIGEPWSVETAKKMLQWWFNKQKDLFFVAEEDGKPIGAIVSGTKPWFDGIRLVDGELFVAKPYQKKHIAKELMRTLLKEAKEKYNATVMDIYTYGEKTDFPRKWYDRIGYKKDEVVFIMHGNIKELLEKIK